MYVVGAAADEAAGQDHADVGPGFWLGDGANSAISAESILGVLGENSVSSFASSLGTDTGTAAAGLAEVLPQLMDKASSGGSLLDAAGGVGGLMNAAKSFLS